MSLLIETEMDRSTATGSDGITVLQSVKSIRFNKLSTRFYKRNVTKDPDHPHSLLRGVKLGTLLSGHGSLLCAPPVNWTASPEEVKAFYDFSE